ncbi:hypothetical protein P692DRAFT_201104502 [Suillus brevipes Sb2]|nr:hypothetical protein P692DRAFT_201104502 [Suillus brevipes Sb2]
MIHPRRTSRKCWNLRTLNEASASYTSPYPDSSPITKLSGWTFLNAWWHIVISHYALWGQNVHHRDISPNNLMVYKISDGRYIGVLIDIDFPLSPSGQEHTGTVPFMAIELLTHVKPRSSTPFPCNLSSRWATQTTHIIYTYSAKTSASKQLAATRFPSTRQIPSLLSRERSSCLSYTSSWCPGCPRYIAPTIPCSAQAATRFDHFEIYSPLPPSSGVVQMIPTTTSFFPRA